MAAGLNDAHEQQSAAQRARETLSDWQRAFSARGAIEGNENGLQGGGLFVYFVYHGKPLSSWRHHLPEGVNAP